MPRPAAGGSGLGVSRQFIVTKREKRHFERMQEWAAGQKGLEDVLVLYEGRVLRKSVGTPPEEAARKAREIRRIWYDEEEEEEEEEEE